MSKQLNKKINIKLIARILSYSKSYKKLFFISLFLTLLLASLAIVRPLLISKALNDFVINQKSELGLNSICLLILFFLIIEAFGQVVNLRLTNLLGQNIVRDLRTQVYSHILQLKNKYFDTTPVGTLVTRAVSDTMSFIYFFKFI